jgi:hypothetical protein
MPASTAIAPPRRARPPAEPLPARRPAYRRRCKYTAGASGGPGDSASLKACQSLLSEYLPKIKALPGAEVTRQVCGGCLDFKVSIVQPLEAHGAFMEDLSLEDEFLEKLKKIDGVSQVETQEITFVKM